jgi:hypothetical protein
MTLAGFIILVCACVMFAEKHPILGILLLIVLFK